MLKKMAWRGGGAPISSDASRRCSASGCTNAQVASSSRPWAMCGFRSGRNIQRVIRRPRRAFKKFPRGDGIHLPEHARGKPLEIWFQRSPCWSARDNDAALGKAGIASPCAARSTPRMDCTSLDLIQRSMSDYVIHSTAGIIGEVDSMLSRTRASLARAPPVP